MFILAGEPPLCYLLSIIIIITYLLNTNTTCILAQLAPSSCGAFGYTTGSTYEKNLDTTLSTLPTTNSGHGFYNYSTGLGEDRVNSIALCRGDVNLDVCQQCLKDSIVNLLQECPNQKEALGYYDYCMLRYSNEIIVGNADTNSFSYAYTRSRSQITDVGEFNKALTQLYNNLTVKAAAGDTLLKFATGSDTIGSDNTRIYVLVQCTPYLNKEQCSNCFDSITQNSNWLNGMFSGKFFRSVCNIIYDTQPFYNETNEVKQKQQQQQQPSPPPTILQPSLQPPSPQPPKNLQPSLQPPSPQPPEKKKKNKRSRILLLIITAVVTVIVIVSMIIAIFLRLRKKKNQTKPPPEIHPEFDRYPFDTVKAATNSFSETENKLGSGGFGEVYKGTLEDGKIIAVKRLKSSNDQRDTEFVNEVSIVAKLQHRNLVKLLGYSIKESERLLILEFLPNGSLDDYLFNAKCVDLDWKSRYNIIKGIARGLVYLHIDSRLKIIHHDMKAANVLLDANLEPKIADFGTAKLFKTSETHRDTKQRIGTLGYMAPEYLISGHITVKLDVFSFGVLVLEIVTGQKLQNFHTEEGQLEYLPHYAWKSLKNDKIPDIIDRNMKFEPTLMHEINRSVQIGLLCVQKKAADRPTMDSVVDMLNSSLSMPLPFPAAPSTSTEDDIYLKTLSSSGMRHGSSSTRKEDSNSIMET